MTVTQKGQVTIPNSLRKRHGLTRGTGVIFVDHPEGVLVKPDPEIRVVQLKKALKRVRGSADAGLTTDGILSFTRD